MPSKHYFTVGIRVHENEWLACKTAAKLAGQTLSMWGRRAIVASLPEDLAQVAVLAKEVDDEPEAEAPARRDDAAVTGSVPENRTVAPAISPAVVEEASAGEPYRLPGCSLERTADATRTYNRNDLCIRCQRIGPSCGPCRALTRDRMPE